MSARLTTAINTLLFAFFVISCNSELTKNDVELNPIFRIANTKNSHFLVLGYFDYTSTDYKHLVRQIKASPIAEHDHILIQDRQNIKSNLTLTVKKSNFLKNNRTIKKILLADTESNGVIDIHEIAF